METKRKVLTFLLPKKGDVQMEKNCGILKILALLGGKWKLLILWRIYQNDGIRFNELKRKTNGITNVMLVRCLDDLITYGFVYKHDYKTIPPRVEYYLTDLGKKFLPIMKEMNKWGNENLSFIE